MSPMRVWKYNLGVGHNTISMPPGATVLSVIDQRGAVVLYAAVKDLVSPVQIDDPEVGASSGVKEVDRHFYVANTGEEFDVGFPAQAEFVGTVREPGNYVRHVFETMAPEDAAEVVETEAELPAPVE